MSGLVSLFNVGNQVPRYSGWKLLAEIEDFLGNFWLETKYRDIADGNTELRLKLFVCLTVLETKYRDIADGNHSDGLCGFLLSRWKPSTAI